MLCRELLEQKKRPGDGRCSGGSARHASFVPLPLPLLSFPFRVVAPGGRWTTLNILSVLSSSLRAPILPFISRIAPALSSLWEFFCAPRPKRANESTQTVIHFNSCPRHPCTDRLSLLMHRSPHPNISTLSPESVHQIGISAFQGDGTNGTCLGVYSNDNARGYCAARNASRSRSWRLETKETIHLACMKDSRFSTG